jgi:hypothetical protein
MEEILELTNGKITGSRGSAEIPGPHPGSLGKCMKKKVSFGGLSNTFFTLLTCIIHTF